MYNIASSVKNHRLYPEFLRVRNRLASHQFVCWIAGGAVRDFCLNREVSEFDLVTDASTLILKELFPDAVLVGESFGVVKIPLQDGEFFDLATFREEAEYLDGRRPSQVVSSTPTKDSIRRDFTVNAMYWDDQASRIVDYQGGLSDLRLRILACVGDPDTRFNEDFLRILRLVRFGVQLGFEFETKTEEAAFRKKESVSRVSGERIWAELRKMEIAGRWNDGLRQRLFCEVLREVFSIVKPLPPQVQDNTPLLLLVYMLDPETDFTGLLKSRFRISNAELQDYSAVRFLLQNYDKLSTAEMAFSLEKNPFFRQWHKRLGEAGVLPLSFVSAVEKCLNDHAEMLVVPQDLVGKIPNHFISEELKLIRINQMNGVYRTKADALDYLKKKYAN